jgi:hypothetical protein
MPVVIVMTIVITKHSRRSRWKHGLYSSEGRAEQKRVHELVRTSRELLKRL